MTVKDGDGEELTQIYTATISANAGWFDEYDNNLVTDEFGLDDITTPVESNYATSKTKTFGTANKFNFENSLVPADDK